MASQVAVAEVAVVPTFKGFRRQVSNETDTSAKAASQGFSRTFSKTGTDSGKTVGTGFRKAFEQSSKGTSDRLVKSMEANVAKTARAVSDARLKEQDAAGKVRVAERQLAEAREKYSKDSSQVVRAEERMETASRNLMRAHERTEDSTDDLKKAQGELARAADRAGDELSEAGTNGVTGFRSNVVGGVKSFAGPLIAAFAALGIGRIVANAFNDAKDFIVSTVDIASDLSESVNAVEVAYGDAADEVLKLGENSAQAFGLSQKDLNAYATQFSAFVGTIAGSGGDVAGTLETLVGRGTDFASVFNTEVSEALGLFQSGLAGETEPLRKYGIDLSAAAVEAYALANGIGDSTGSLTEAEKVQARYGSLLEQTSKVQGDFANTSGELANMNRINAAEWDNIQAKIGNAFLPVAQQLATILADDLLPAISDLAEEYGPELGDAFTELLPSLRDLAVELLPLIPTTIEAIVAAMPAFVTLLQLVTPLLISMTQATTAQNTVFSGLFGLLTGDTSLEQFTQDLMALGGPIAAVLSWGGGLVTGFQTWFATIPSAVETGVNKAIEWLRGLPGKALTALGDLGTTLLKSGESLMQGFLDGINNMFAPIGNAVEDALGWLGGFFPHSPALRGPLSGSGWTAIRKSGEAYWDQFLGGMGKDGPSFPDLPVFSGVGATAGSRVAERRSTVGRRVVQNIYPQQTDARLQMRQWGREAERAFAAS